MAKSRGPKWVDVPLIAESLRAAVASPGRVAPLDALGRVAEELVALDRARVALLVKRDRLVSELRAAGVPWDAVTGAAGATRQALIKRG